MRYFSIFLRHWNRFSENILINVSITIFLENTKDVFGLKQQYNDMQKKQMPTKIPDIILECGNAPMPKD